MRYRGRPLQERAPAIGRRRKMKNPLSGGLVLPPTWCQRIADDGHGPNAAHGLSAFD
jgi:hypothetical protein